MIPLTWYNHITSIWFNPINCIIGSEDSVPGFTILTIFTFLYLLGQFTNIYCTINTSKCTPKNLPFYIKNYMFLGNIILLHISHAKSYRIFACFSTFQTKIIIENNQLDIIWRNYFSFQGETIFSQKYNTTKIPRMGFNNLKLGCLFKLFNYKTVFESKRLKYQKHETLVQDRNYVILAKNWTTTS